jgi:hypothetical protein
MHLVIIQSTPDGSVAKCFDCDWRGTVTRDIRKHGLANREAENHRNS